MALGTRLDTLTDQERVPHDLPNPDLQQRRRVVKLNRTDDIETLYDLTTLLAERLATGAIPQDLLPDSRSRLDLVLYWTNQFNEIYGWSDWADEDYLGTVQNWFEAKVRALSHHVFNSGNDR